jgi:hypothetical protein
MHQMDQKKLLATRIIAYLNPVPANAVQTLLQKSLPDLEALLDRLATQKAQGDSEEEVIAYREDSRREAAFESAYVHGLLQISLNGKRLGSSSVEDRSGSRGGIRSGVPRESA